MIFSIFSYANGLLIHPLWRNVHSSPLFFNWIAYIFIADVQEIFFYSGYQSLMKYMIVWFKYMIFSHSVDCISLFWQCPWIYKHFKFWLSPAYLFLLLLPELFVSYPIKHFQIQCHAILFLFFFHEFDSLALTFSSLSYFQLIFTYDIKNTIFFFNA